MSGDWVELSDLVLDCVIGVHEWEQRIHQRLAIDLRMGLSLEAAAAGDLDRSVDYTQTVEQVAMLAQQGRWRMLESLGAAICRLLLAPPCRGEERAQVQHVEVRLRKPDVLDGRAVPGVTLSRPLSWCDLQTQQIAPACAADVLQETRVTGAYRLHLEAGGRWEVPPAMALLVLAGPVVVDGVTHPKGTAIGRGVFAVHNPGVETAVLLAVGTPLPGAI